MPEKPDRSFLLDPFPFYAKMRCESPVAGDAKGGSWVIAEILGVPVRDRESFKRWSDGAVLNDPQRGRHGLAALPEQAGAAGVRGDGRLEELLAEARAAAADDDPGAGLEKLLRYGLRCQLDDVGLAAVLRSPKSALARTSRLCGPTWTPPWASCWMTPASRAPSGKASGPTTSGACCAASSTRCGWALATAPRSTGTSACSSAAYAPTASPPGTRVPRVLHPPES